jgi:hypothetical protein
MASVLKERDMFKELKVKYNTIHLDAETDLRPPIYGLVGLGLYHVGSG